MNQHSINHPKAFISYAWESEEVKGWVRQLATKLRDIGIDAKLDQWEVVPGDQMPLFMEKSVRENDYVLIVCSPKYKMKSENRIGGVGYEGDIMTAEVLQSSNHRKFIPILQSGTKETSIPSWLSGKYYVDLSNHAHFESNFEDLTTTLLNTRELAPALGAPTSKTPLKPSTLAHDFTETTSSNVEEIRIKGIVVDEVTKPLNDGTRGSALYKIPFELNMRPNYEWIELFIQAWDRPSRFTSMHRPGIASINGNKIYLDGTTMEEVERYHRDTLKLAVEVANTNFKQIHIAKSRKEEEAKRQQAEHRKSIEDINKRINFDD